MATENIIATSLPEYVEQNRIPLLNAVILTGDTIARMRKQTGIKTKAAINYLDTDPTFQDGSTCGFNPQGTATMTQREIATGQIKVNMDFCPRTLLGTYAEYLVRIGAGEDELPFEQYLMENITGRIREKMETAVWQGDTGSEDADLKLFDGLIKIATDESTVNKVPIAKGTAAYDAIKAVYMAIPEAILNKNVKIFVSPSLYRDFMQDMVEKNYYHYSGPQAETPREFVFPGTNVAVVNTVGLTGTNSIIASTEENMYYGCDLENDSEKIDLWFSKDNDVFRLKIAWNAGVQFAYPDLVVLGTIATE